MTLMSLTTQMKTRRLIWRKSTPVMKTHPRAVIATPRGILQIQTSLTTARATRMKQPPALRPHDLQESRHLPNSLQV